MKVEVKEGTLIQSLSKKIEHSKALAPDLRELDRLGFGVEKRNVQFLKKAFGKYGGTNDESGTLAN